MSDAEKGVRLDNGTIFKSRYEITGFLGEGGFATVHSARDVEIGREVAIKILHILATTMDPTTHMSIVERFRQEARTAAQIKHPAVVTIFDVGMTEDNHPYIIMDYLSGHDLEAELEKNGPMELARALPLFCRCLEALSEAHRLGIVHKDLKPSNLFLTDPGAPHENISILDFGIARVTEDTDARLTSAGQILGTPRYMAPEYIDNQTVSSATDVYQMGLILIEMLQGVPVVKQETLISCIMVHATGVDLPPELVGTPLEEVLRGATHKDPNERIPDCDTFLQKLYYTDFSAMGLPNAASLIQTRTTTSRMMAIDPSMGPPVGTPPVPVTPPVNIATAPTPIAPVKSPGSQTAEVSAGTGGGGGMGLKIAIGLFGLLILGALAVVGLGLGGIINIPGLSSDKDGGEVTDGDKDGDKDSDATGPDALIAKGEEHMEKGEWKDAIDSFKAVLKDDSDNDKAKKLKKKAEKEKKLAKTFESGEKALAKGKVKDAQERFDKIPEDSYYASQIKAATSKAVEESLSDAEAAIKKDDASAARAALAIASAIDPDNKAIAKLKKKLPKGGPTVAIAGGAFTRGSSPDAVKAAVKICRDAPAGARCSAGLFGAEQPDKKIGISPYEIDKFEVTNADYEACVDAKACTAARYSTTCGGEDKAIKSDEHPVVCVTHKDADTFCRWADKRLPTEAEWEFAARGDKGTRTFPWGDDWKPKWANWGDKGSDDGHKYTSPVGGVSKDESPFGAMDMGGNVSEWVADGFGKKFYGEDKALNPVNVKDTKERTIRGGNWQSGGHTVRVSFREGLKPDKFNGTTGFRCARTK